MEFFEAICSIIVFVFLMCVVAFLVYLVLDDR